MAGGYDPSAYSTSAYSPTAYDFGGGVTPPPAGSLLEAIADSILREMVGAVQYLNAAYTGSTPPELDAAIRQVADRAAYGAITYVPAALKTYYFAHL